MLKFIVFKTKYVDDSFMRQMDKVLFIDATCSDEAEEIAAEYPEGDPSDYIAFEFTDDWQNVADKIQLNNPVLT